MRYNFLAFHLPDMNAVDATVILKQDPAIVDACISTRPASLVSEAPLSAVSAQSFAG
jgi:hypothetical protein